MRKVLRTVLTVALVVGAVAAPVAAFAEIETFQIPLIEKIDIDDGGGDPCGGHECPTTTTTKPVQTTTTTTTPVETTTTTKPTETTTTTLPPATTTTASPTTTTTAPPAPDGSDEPTPATGLGSLDMDDMSSSMAGAVVMIKAGDEMPLEDPDMDETGMGMMSDGFYDILSPVLPPAVVDAVSSPLVIVDALLGALASSGQALIVPAIAFLFGFGVPGASPSRIGTPEGRAHSIAGSPSTWLFLAGRRPIAPAYERTASPAARIIFDAPETGVRHPSRMREGDVRRMIAEAAAGAGDGADALRRAGVPVVLEVYTVEVLVDAVDAAPAASVKVSFVASGIVGEASPGGPQVAEGRGE
jgi:hypothetical protein